MAAGTETGPWSLEDVVALSTNDQSSARHLADRLVG